MLPISTQLWLIISPIFGKDSEQKSTRNPIHQGARDHSHRQVVFGQALLSHETNGEDVGVAATLRPQNGGIPRIPWTSHPFPCKMGSKMHRSNSVDTNPRFRLGGIQHWEGIRTPTLMGIWWADPAVETQKDHQVGNGKMAHTFRVFNIAMENDPFTMEYHGYDS